MSDKNPKQNKPLNVPGKIGTHATSKVANVYPSWLNYALLGGILILTFWCYHYSLGNQFTNWDDDKFIIRNMFIRSFSHTNLMKMLFTDVTKDYYNPLTMVSYAINYHFSELSPQSYYVTEIAMHLINTILVFFLSLALFKAMVKKGYGEIKGIPYLAGLCALWFGIHPMHVESVSWIAERKDVLYVFFYLLGLIVYVKYVLENKTAQMAFVAVMFFFSLFSKPMAIVFPFSLFTIDILLKRKIKWKLFIEKIPLVLISIMFAYLTFKAQTDSNSIMPYNFTFFQRIMIVCYNYMMYLVKWFVPYPLSSYYPYPDPTSSHDLPFYFYITFFAASAVTFGLVYFAYKKSENYFRVVLFGFGFYFFNVMLILQFVSAGINIMADRYSYAAYIGFTFMIVYFIYILVNKFPAFKNAVIIVVAAFSCMLTYLCEARTHVWHDSETLWTDVIAQYPHKIYLAYGNLGDYYFTHSDFNKAGDNFREAINLNTPKELIYSDMGSVSIINKQYQAAVGYLNTAEKIDTNDNTLYLRRGYAYYLMGQNELALKDYNHSFRLDSIYKPLLEDRAALFLYGTKNYPAAIADYSRLITIDPTISQYYVNRGLSKGEAGYMKDGIEDFNKALKVDSNNATCWYDLSFVYWVMKSYPMAINYAYRAQQHGYKLPRGYISRLQSLAKSNGQ